MKSLLFYSLLAGIILSGCGPRENRWELNSPDGRISLQVHLTDSATLEYSVSRMGSTVVEPSPMGIIREDTELFGGFVFVEASEVRVVDEEYTLTSGRQLACRNHAGEMILSFENAAGEQMGLQLRAYDDGVAFRYIFPGEPGNAVTVVAELTGFNIPAGSNAWMHPYDRVSQTSPAYETCFEGPIPAGTRAPEEMNGWAFPMLFQTGETWILVSESGLDDNYCGVHLDAHCEGGLYRVRFPEEEEAMGLCARRFSRILLFRRPRMSIVRI